MCGPSGRRCKEHLIFGATSTSASNLICVRICQICLVCAEPTAVETIAGNVYWLLRPLVHHPLPVFYVLALPTVLYYCCHYNTLTVQYVLSTVLC